MKLCMYVCMSTDREGGHLTHFQHWKDVSFPHLQYRDITLYHVVGSFFLVFQQWQALHFQPYSLTCKSILLFCLFLVQFFWFILWRQTQCTVHAKWCIVTLKSSTLSTGPLNKIFKRSTISSHICAWIFKSFTINCRNRTNRLLYLSGIYRRFIGDFSIN